MKMDDFIVNRETRSAKHKIYPIQIFFSEDPDYHNWYYNLNQPELSKVRIIKELRGINPEDVSDELFNLIILKYSML